MSRPKTKEEQRKEKEAYEKIFSRKPSKETKGMGYMKKEDNWGRAN